MKTYYLDGEKFSTLEEFYDEIGQVLIPDANWGKNLDAFNDILRGGFGTPEEGFILIWQHSTLSRKRLGYQETVRQLQKRMERCHPSAIVYTQQQLEAARCEEGTTVFDWLVEVIKEHSEITLVLE